MNGKVMPVRIVPMKTEHLDAVAELERSCFTVPWSRNALAEELDNALSAFLVALDENDRVVGYAGLQVVLDEGYITNVAVRPDCRRRGVAGALLRYVVDDMRSAGIGTLYLLTDLCGFYERFGWEYLCGVRGDGEERLSRMYIHR